MNEVTFSTVESSLIAGQTQKLYLMATNLLPKMLKNVSARVQTEGNWRREGNGEVVFPLIAAGQSAMQPLTVFAAAPGQYTLKLTQVRAEYLGEGLQLPAQTLVVNFAPPQVFEPTEQLTLQVNTAPGKVGEWLLLTWTVQNLAGWSLNEVGLRWKAKGLHVECDEFSIGSLGAGGTQQGTLRMQPLEAGMCQLDCEITAEARGIYGMHPFTFAVRADAQPLTGGASKVDIKGDLTIIGSGNAIGGGTVSGNDFSRHRQEVHHTPVDIQQTVGDGGMGIFRTPLAANTPEVPEARRAGVCPHCNKASAPENRFCTHCGTKLQD